MNFDMGKLSGSLVADQKSDIHDQIENCVKGFINDMRCGSSIVKRV